MGSESPLRSIFVHGFTLTTAERADAMAFLQALTDDSFLADPSYADPLMRH